MSVRKLGLNTVIYGLGGVLNRMISFLLLPLFTRFLTTDDFGRAGMLQILGVFLQAVFALGIGGSLSCCYYKEETEERRRGTVMAAIVLVVLSCAVMMGLLLPVSGAIAQELLGSSEWAGLVVLSLTTFALGIVVLPFVLSIQFAGQSRLFVSLSAVTTGVMAISNIVAVAWLRMGLYGWILSQLIGQGISLIIYSVPFWRHGIPRLCRATLKTLLLLGLPMVPSFFCLYVIQQGNRYAVEEMHGLSEMGIYNAAVSLAAVSSMAVTAFQTSWSPYCMSFRNRLEEAKSAFGKATTWFFCFMGLSTICFFSFAQPVVELMAGPAFHEAWRSIGAVAVANFLLGATHLLVPAQYFSDKLGHLTAMQAITAGVSLNINLWMLYWGGPAAAGFALLLSYAFMLGLHFWWNHKGLSMRLPVRYEWRRLAVVAVCIAAVAAVTLSFPARAQVIFGIPMSSVLTGFIRGVLMSGGFAVVLWMFLPPEVRQTVLKRIGLARRESPAPAP